MTQVIPTVNVVMTYDPMVMMKFQETGSLDAFKTKATKDVKIFNNSPNSNFISLVHDFGFSRTGEGAASSKIELEFIDPESVFDTMLDISPNSLLSVQDDLLIKTLEEKKEALQGLEENNKFATNAWYNPFGWGNDVEESVEVDWVDAEIARLEQEIEELEEVLDSDFDEDDAVSSRLDAVQKQLDIANSDLQRPVWISYGIGNNLTDWCPPMCFNQPVGLEFTFNAQGARVIKLIYDGQSIHPNLSPLGIKPLGSLGVGTVLAGSSGKLFNRDATQVLKKEWPTVVYDQSYTWKPSLHKTITDTIRNFILRCTKSAGGTGNVVVLLPDMDNLLEGYYNTCYNDVKSSNGDYAIYRGDNEEIYGDQMWNMQATKECLMGCGFTISDTKEGFTAPISDIIFKNIEDQIDGGGNPRKIITWLNKRDIRCQMSTDGILQTAKEKLDEISTKIQALVNDYWQVDIKEDLRTGAPPFSCLWYVETDFNALQVMAGAGIIPDGTKPAIIFGDRTTIALILEARLQEGSDPLSTGNQSFLKVSIDKKLNKFDVVAGFDDKLVKNLFDIFFPVPWLGPFGPTNSYKGSAASLDMFLADDTNLESDSYDSVKNDDPAKFGRMPIFSFGTKNANILEFLVDINKQYFNLLNSFDFVGMTSDQLTTAVLGPEAKEEKAFLDNIKSLQKLQLNSNTGTVNTNIVPDAFKGLIEEYWDEDWVGEDGSADSSFEQWEAVFNAHGLEDYKNITDHQVDSKEAFFEFMWKAFCALTAKDWRMSIKNARGSGATIINKYTKIADSLSSQVLLGSIKTTPMFHLSNRRRVINRKSLLLAIEPRYGGLPPQKKEAPNTTWFSGMYQLTGFKHTINKSSVFSEFSFNRPASQGGLIQKIR